MKRFGRNILLLLWLTGFLLGCATKKNTSSARVFHNMASRYNIYFNAKESVKAGLLRIDENVIDDYTHILPIYKTSDPDAATLATAEMELAIQKCSKLIALHSITRSPKRKSNKSERYQKFASKGEYNEWVDDSYLLMGEASYYMHDYHRATENFNYVIRKFTNNSSRYNAFLGLAKTYIETGEYDKVPEILKLLERDGGMPKSLKKDLNLAYANLYIKSGKPADAIPFLQTAMQYRMTKKEKVRSNYILAQLLAQNAQPDEAAKLFSRIVKMRPEVDMAFNAKISALELASDDAEDATQKLLKMLKDPNNKKFSDRLYYALGQIALRTNQSDVAIEYFRTSVAHSTENTKQRAMSSLTVAKILFEDKNYQLSSAYYDSTLAVIDPSYPEYSGIISKAVNLRRLSNNLNTISREDSLQRLAAMPESARNNLINKMINDLQKREQDSLNAERSELTDQNYFRAQQYRQQIRTTDNANLWYFYNPSTAGMGKTEFQRIWGKRRLEDNWRRKNKVSVGQDDTEPTDNLDENLVTQSIQPKVTDPKTKEYYLQDIPLTDSLLTVSTEKIKNSYFDAGRIYRSAFTDYPKSIEMLEELIRRFPGCMYELPAWIELHQMFVKNADDQNAAIYKDKITTKYPGSRYAMYLSNPNYFRDLEEQRAKIDAKFTESVDYYGKRNFTQAAKSAFEVLALKPDSNIMAKAKFIELTANGSNIGNEDFIHSLDNYIQNFPKTPTAEIAINIRDLLRANSLADYQQLLASGFINENIVNDELKSGNRAENDEFGGKFSYDEDMFHYYVVAFPKQAGVEVNRLIFDIANYNIDYYTATDFDVESVNLNNKTQMVVVRSMPNKEEGLIYFKSIIRKRQVFNTLSGVDYNNFSASSANYRSIIADKDYSDYLKFFMKNYSPYIGSDYPKDEIEAPSELLAKARQVEQPAEKGKFVYVEPEIIKDQYVVDNNAQHSFVITVKDSDLSLAPIVAQFINFNATVHPNQKITVSTQKLDGQHSLFVSGIGNSEEAMAYFREVIAYRELFSDLEEAEYSNFIITENNEKVLQSKKDLQGYVGFFRENYLNIKKVEDEPTVAEPFADYVGPYITQLSNENLFVLVFPTEGVNANQLVNLFENFNSTNFGSPNIIVKTEPLDDFRSMLIVSGLGEHSAAVAYFRRANSNPSLYAPIKGASYRYFAISTENFEIFRKNKNLQLYMDFFNRVKW